MIAHMGLACTMFQASHFSHCNNHMLYIHIFIVLTSKTLWKIPVLMHFIYSNHLFIFLAGEKIAGIEYNPESLQGMRDNLDRVLQFMAGKRIRMHHITSKEILEGNLKAVMRLILALAAHYKPQSVRHHDVSYENLDKQPQQQQQHNEPEHVSKTEGTL